MTVFPSYSSFFALLPLSISLSCLCVVRETRIEATPIRKISPLGSAEFDRRRIDDVWDYYVFAQRLSATNKSYVNNGGNETTRPTVSPTSNKAIVITPAMATDSHSRQEWVIHGLWPTKRNTADPNYCLPNSTLDLAHLSPLIPELRRVWPNLLENSTADNFWQYEWTKHGTCMAAGIKPYSYRHTAEHQFAYFATALALYWRLDMHVALTTGTDMNDQLMRRGISRQQLDGLLRSVFRGRAGVKCKKATMGGQKKARLFIEEIRLCLSKDFVIIDCPEADAFDDCGDLTENDVIWLSR